MITPQKYGFIIEEKITEFLRKTNYYIYTEKEIRRNYSYITAIDQMIILDDMCICFQDKWLNKTISNSMFSHFINNCNYIQNILNRKVIGIYLSNYPLSKEANKMLSVENNKNLQSVLYYSIHDFEFNRLLDKLHNILHDNNIFIYEEPNSDYILMAPEIKN